MDNNLLSHQYDPIADEFSKVIEVGNATSTKAFRKLVPELKNLSVLDIGCGDGTDCAYYKSQGAGYVAGIDASRELLHHASQKTKDVDFKYGLFEKLPFEDSGFDNVFSKYALQTAPKLEPIFMEVNRVLKSGGIFTLLVVHPIRQFYEKKKVGKDYFRQEVVSSVCFDGALTFQEPSHTLKEYYSKYMLKNFELVAFEEQFEPAAEKIVDTYPGFLILQWKKR